ncbi:MAG: hemolysin D, partial [Candidatus Methanofastidiosa archaeon]|nr:hemolysin D [Candidatus Methanofastidiosa archaeon]
MISNQIKEEQTIGEEIFNSITHGVGAITAIVGLIFLIFLAFKHRQPIFTIAYLIYGISLFFLYLMSTLYHSIQAEKAKKVFKKLDHIAIFVLIAG